MAEGGPEAVTQPEPQQLLTEPPAQGETSTATAAAAGGPRQRGTVKWFNATKGFGFITPEGGGEDLFVHQTNIRTEGFRSLREGEPVEFEVEAGPDGRFKAINISGPAGTAPQGAPPRAAQARPGYLGGRHAGGRGPGAGVPGMAGVPSMAGPMPYGGRGPPMAAAMAPQQAFYGAYGMPAQSFYVGYYFPPGADPMGGRGRGGGRGRVGYAPQPQAFYPAPGMPAMLPPPPQPPVPQVPTTPAEPSGLQVVVHNLPWSCQWQHLKDTFKQWRVERADVVFDAWGRSRGFGTVRFYSREDAEAACAKLNNSQMEGRTISVRLDRFA